MCSECRAREGGKGTVGSLRTAMSRDGLRGAHGDLRTSPWAAKGFGRACDEGTALDKRHTPHARDAEAAVVSGDPAAALWAQGRQVRGPGAAGAGPGAPLSWALSSGGGACLLPSGLNPLSLL